MYNICFSHTDNVEDSCLYEIIVMRPIVPLYTVTIYVKNPPSNGWGLGSLCLGLLPIQNLFLLHCVTINTLLALKNCIIVFPHPQELYNNKHMEYGHEPYKEGLYHIYSTLYTLANVRISMSVQYSGFNRDHPLANQWQTGI